MACLLFSSSSIVYPCKVTRLKSLPHYLWHQTIAAHLSPKLPFKCPFVRCNSRHCHTQNSSCSFRKKPLCGSRLIARTNSSRHLSALDSEVDYGSWEDQDLLEEDDKGSPWEGAIVYKRNPSISHLEYCTTLERLGLGKLSTEISRKRASVMGLRVTKAVKNEYPDGTPVLVSLDVTRKKGKLRLDGIIRTVITLGCNRCGEQAAESVFSDFSLLLSEEPIDEQDTINMGTIFGEEKFRTFESSKEEEEGDDHSIDLDDQLYFPPEEKVIDISKHIRDLVHVEITINALCDPMCKGLCLRCGTNLNVSSCYCGKQKVEEQEYGPLGSLRKQMQQK